MNKNKDRKYLYLSHEIDDEEDNFEKVKSTIQIMGFSCFQDKLPHGELIYRKRLGRLRPPRNKRFGKHTYFDDDGNPYDADQVIIYRKSRYFSRMFVILLSRMDFNFTTIICFDFNL